MVGILIAFILNNVVWAIFVVYLISLFQNKSLPRLLPKKKQAEDDSEFEEASDDQISSHLSNLQEKIGKNIKENIIKDESAFDGEGNRVNVGEEKAVD